MTDEKVYLESELITDKCQSPVYNRGRSVITTKKIATCWMVQLKGEGRWRRVYMACVGDDSLLFIDTKNGRLWLGSYDPSK